MIDPKCLYGHDLALSDAIYLSIYAVSRRCGLLRLLGYPLFKFIPADLHLLLACFFAPVPSTPPLLLQLLLLLLSGDNQVAVLLPSRLLANLLAIFSRPKPAI